jgi:hypothetical protein
MMRAADPRVLLVPMHPGMQYHFARVGLPTYLLGNWDQFQYWRPRPSNVVDLIQNFHPRQLAFRTEDYRQLLDGMGSYPEGFDIVWLHFPWQVKMFWDDPHPRKVYFAAKRDELSEGAWEALLGRSDFTVASYYRPTTDWVRERFGIELKEIQLGLDPDLYRGWTGDKAVVLSVIHSWKSRGWHYDAYLAATEDLHALHVDHLDRSKPLVGYAELLDLFRSCRVYLHDGEREYTVVLIEAMMTGMPIVSFDMPGIENYVEHGVNGFVCRTTREIHDYCTLLLADRDIAARFGAASRAKALLRHHEERWRSDWKNLIENAL